MKMKKRAFPRRTGEIAALLLWLLAGACLCTFLGTDPVAAASGGAQVDTADTFQREITQRINPILSEAIPTIVETKKTYRLTDSQLVAPKPDPRGYGELSSTAELAELLSRPEAVALLDGQSTLLTTETELFAGSTIRYYLDETILAMTWKQVVNNCVYTFGEVKIADASQFRRFMADGKYNSGQLYTTTEMASSVNAVLASAGDFYGYRSFGIVVNEGHVYRGKGLFLDTCYIDEEGKFLFTYAGEILDEDSAQAFVDENNVRFTLCFGPVMVRDGEYCVPREYNSGEINNPYARAALCEMGELHYVVVNANAEDPHYALPRVSQFGKSLQEMGIPTAYAIDGGQTATIVLNNQVINKVSHGGAQRNISDIFYFATALDSSGGDEE